MCPHCDRTYRTRTEGMGKVAVCSKCRRSFKIGDKIPPFEWKPTSIAEDSWVGVEPPEEKEERKHCMMCQAPLEPDQIICDECGTNQITGLKRQVKAPPKEVRVPVSMAIPWGTIGVIAFIMLAGAGVFYGIVSMFSSAAESGVEMRYQRLINQAARHIAEGGDARSFAEESAFLNQVTDENLPRFLMTLSAGDPMIRKAGQLLIAEGNVQDLSPLIAMVDGEDQAAAIGAKETLQAIGPRELVRQTENENEAVRWAAAEGLCILFDLPRDESTVGSLAEPTRAGVKIERLNELCRPWPRATGEFEVVFEDEQATFPAKVRQIGNVFYLQLGRDEFRSLYDEPRTFRLSPARWAAATGPAIDEDEVAEFLEGSIVLNSPHGEGWQGTVLLTLTRPITGELPGFLPVAPPEPDHTVEADIALIRPD
jgi:hypothetical protein